MSELLPELIFNSAARTPDAPALSHGKETLTYAQLAERVRAVARGLLEAGIGRSERVGIYLEKRLETVIAMFGAAAAGAVFVPINPLLRARQVGYILRDCNVRVLVTSADRLALLAPVLAACPDLRTVVLTDGDGAPARPAPHVNALAWQAAFAAGAQGTPHRVIDTDMAAIFYTSGSTGLPKGVVLSHRNMVAGAKSVSTYLKNTPDDRILSVLPLSFDAGFSQLSTAFNVGACTVLMNYLLPQDVMKAVVREKITGLACVPPLWIQLAQLDMPEAAARLERLTNSGGALTPSLINSLSKLFENADIYPMYGLTEAFRSTYLDPGLVALHPQSMGKAIPFAEILVVRPDGGIAADDEPGELVHAGPLVAQGYWNDAERTASRFKPAPAASVYGGTAVWSGDTVRRDAEGLLYFVGRDDEMIKVSGNRISPTEIEEAAIASGATPEAVAVGVPDDRLGQAIILVARGTNASEPALFGHFKAQLPAFMMPRQVVWRAELPRNANGKLDRAAIRAELLS